MNVQQIAADGGVVFWSVGEYIHRETLEKGLEAIGLGYLVPAPRRPSALLRDALDKSVAKPRTLIRSAGAGIFNVVNETVDQTGVHGNEYAVDLIVSVDDQTGELGFIPSHHHDRFRIEAEYERQRDLIRGAQVSEVLVKSVRMLGGVPLRPNGAIYWLPSTSLGQYEAIGSAVEAATVVGSAGKSACYTIRHKFDAKSLKAVADAVVAEITAEAEKLASEIGAGDLGKRALEFRVDQAESLKGRLEWFEQILGRRLADVHQSIQKVKAAGSQAVMDLVVAE